MLAFRISSYLSLLALLLICLVLTTRFKCVNQPIRLFSFYLFGSLLIQITSQILWEMGINNIWLIHLFSVFQLINLSIFFYQIIPKRKIRKSIVLLSSLVSIYWVVNLWLAPSLFEFDSLETLITNGVIIGYSVSYFFVHLDYVHSKYDFIVAGILLFSSISMLLFIFGNQLIDIQLINQIGLWIFNTIIYLIFLSLIGIQLWKQGYLRQKI